MRIKIDLYRRWARIVDEAQLADFAAELVDRFGPRPDPVEQMISQGEMRIWAHQMSIRSIHIEDDYVVFSYADRAAIRALVDRSKGHLRLVDDQTAYLPMSQAIATSGRVTESVKSLLRPE